MLNRILTVQESDTSKADSSVAADIIITVLQSNLFNVASCITTIELHLRLRLRVAASAEQGAPFI
jgi:hypothetical protein